jgi:hypothetical protein
MFVGSNLAAAAFAGCISKQDKVLGSAEGKVAADERRGTAYLRETSYAFPVIRAPELADKLFPWVGLPTNLLVNAKGLRTSLYQFGTDTTSLQSVSEDLKAAANERQ